MPDPRKPDALEAGGPRHICTLADSGYLHFVLALHASVREHCDEWMMHVVCLDEQAFEVLERLDRPGLHLIPVGELIDLEPMLEVVRKVRPLSEFARACKPHAIRRVLADPVRADVVTWIDADAMCFAGLDPVLEELGSESILLAPQALPPAFREIERRTGRFMGGLVSFRNDETGRAAAEWWATRCLVGGCPRVADPIRFGDQKYLQGIPEEFDRVAVTSDISLFLAPFNIERHEVTAGPRGPLVDGRELVIYQYTGFHEVEGGGYEATFPPWRLTRNERELIYAPFRARIADARLELRRVDPSLPDVTIPHRSLRERAVGAGSRIKGSALRAAERLRPAGT